MTIRSVETRVVPLPLARPYTIAFRSITAVEVALVVLRDAQGRIGLGTATPESHVTGESYAACSAAVGTATDLLVGADVRTLPTLARALAERLPHTPAARAALDMALHDLLARTVGAPLVDLLGRAHERLPTSITIGIKPTDEALREADEYLGRGFRILKVKLGRAFDEDVDRLCRLRDHVGPSVKIRVDPNQGYSVEQTRALLQAISSRAIEFVEQPVPVADTFALRALEAPGQLCVDEALLTPADALPLAIQPRPADIFNVKLMKCGGIRPALQIAAIAEAAGVSLMWGCMDESRVGIAAALHAALSSPATRYLDLDGSFDLARDVAEGGFVVEEGGFMRPTGLPGLGASLRDGVL